MHVAVFGAGALGRVFGAHLAQVGITVTFIVRPGREHDRTPIRLERVEKAVSIALAQPVLATTIARDADIVLLCVRREQLDQALLARLKGETDCPIVVMSPMLPPTYDAWHGELGNRLVPGMPAIVAYQNETGTVRYWLPASKVLVEETRDTAPKVREFVDALNRSGIRSKLEFGVHEINPALTVALAPWFFSIGIAGTVAALAENAELLELTGKAAKECRGLASRMGSMPFVGSLSCLLSPGVVRMGARWMMKRKPEAVHYVDEHFGTKLAAQHHLMISDVLWIAGQKGVPCPSVENMRRWLEQRGA